MPNVEHYEYKRLGFHHRSEKRIADHLKSRFGIADDQVEFDAVFGGIKSGFHLKDKDIVVFYTHQSDFQYWSDKPIAGGMMLKRILDATPELKGKKVKFLVAPRMTECANKVRDEYMAKILEMEMPGSEAAAQGETEEADALTVGADEAIQEANENDDGSEIDDSASVTTQEEEPSNQ